MFLLIIQQFVVCGVQERKDPREMMLAKRKADRKIMREMLHACGASTSRSTCSAFSHLYLRAGSAPAELVIVMISFHTGTSHMYSLHIS